MNGRHERCFAPRNLKWICSLGEMTSVGRNRPLTEFILPLNDSVWERETSYT